jgi:CARDB
MRLLTAFFATLLIVASAPQAFAFSYKTCLGKNIRFSGTSRVLWASNVSFPSGYWENGIFDSIDKFNTNPGNFTYQKGIVFGSVGRDNGYNEVWGTSDQGLLGGAPARAFQYWTCYWAFGDRVHMDEVDIVFDYGTSPFIWTADTWKYSLIRYGGSGRALQTTGAHEFGHGLILNHVNTEYNIMGNDFEHIHVNGSTATAYPGEDAGDGAVFLYGLRPGPFEDLGVVHWKYSGASGEYSDHTRTVIYDTGGAILPQTTINTETGFLVTAGQTVQVEFTYENNGANAKDNVDVGYYLSTDDHISAADRLLNFTWISLTRGDVLTSTFTLTIPTDLAPGDYWIGAFIDDLSFIPENVEVNNATYIPIRVQ